MQIEINKIKQLFDSNISGYKIAQETGLSQGLVYEYKRGDKKVENMTLETAEKLMKFIKENEEMKEMIYLVIDTRENDEFIEDFETLEKANDHAQNMWEHLTENEQKKTRIYVMGLTKEDYEKVQNDETDRWYGDFEDNTLDTFDSDNLK